MGGGRSEQPSLPGFWSLTETVGLMLPPGYLAAKVMSPGGQIEMGPSCEKFYGQMTHVGGLYPACRLNVWHHVLIHH